MSTPAEPLRVKRVRRTRYASYRPCRHACQEQGCGYTCATRFQLIRHTRSHTGERPYVCQVPGCDYATAESTHLTRHMLTHTGERPFACEEPGCGYAAAERGTLTTHMRTHRAQPKRVSFMEPLSLIAPNRSAPVTALRSSCSTVTDGLQLLALAASNL